MTAADEARVNARLADLEDRYALPGGSASRLGSLLGLVRDSRHSLTAVRDPVAGVEVHVADSLAGLGVAEVRTADVIADIGSGAGFPGLVLAIAVPQARVVLVESVGKKAEFLREAAEGLQIGNVEVVAGRAEAWADGRDACDVVTARALARMDVLLEYAVPLLRVGGLLVAWKGRRDPDEERAASVAASVLGMDVPAAHRVEVAPYAAERYLYLSRKVGPTPAGYPRRPGMAAKRPRGGSSRT